jgi:hypothetical protein
LTGNMANLAVIMKHMDSCRWVDSEQWTEVWSWLYDSCLEGTEQHGQTTKDEETVLIPENKLAIWLFLSGLKDYSIISNQTRHPRFFWVPDEERRPKKPVVLILTDKTPFSDTVVLWRPQNIIRKYNE